MLVYLPIFSLVQYLLLFTRLSLSGIVNHLDKDQYNAVKRYLPAPFFEQSNVDDVVATMNEHQMKPDTDFMYQTHFGCTVGIKAMWEAIRDMNLNSFSWDRQNEETPVECALLQIDDFKAKFLKSDGRRTEGYIMLKVVEYL